TDGGGLYRYDIDRNQLSDICKRTNLKLRTVCGIEADLQGNLWITGKAGIARLTLSDDMSVTHYSKSDGLTSNNFSYNATHVTNDGKLLFGSDEGLNIVNPENLDVNREEVKVYLQNLRLFNKDVVPGAKNSPLRNSLMRTNSITLDNSQSVFTLEYTGINFTRPGNIQFAYYLEGLEEDWNYVGSQRSATYTSLQAGTYTFKLKAANNDRVWSEEKAILRIRVLPAWYKSSVALTIYVLLFLGGLFFLNWLLRRRVLERQEVLNERERREQGEQLNQRKLQFFTNISHEFRTPLTLIINPLEQLIEKSTFTSSQSRTLSMIQRNARRMERLVDELMDFRKVNSGKLKIHVHQIDLYNFTKSIIEYFEVESENKAISLEMTGQTVEHLAWVDSGLVEK
ncbi:MAG: triple tyrosine motif-containing protein, partial [Bacteroidota bacterium]